MQKGFDVVYGHKLLGGEGGSNFECQIGFAVFSIANTNIRSLMHCTVVDRNLDEECWCNCLIVSQNNNSAGAGLALGYWDV